LSHACKPFLLCLFWRKGLTFCFDWPGQIHNPPIYALCSGWHDRHIPPHPAFFHWDGVSNFFAWTWLEAQSFPFQLPIWEAGMTGAHHCTQLLAEVWGGKGKAFRELFWPGWSGIMIFLIPASQEGRITQVWATSTQSSLFFR
jgi:hypothetical protein